MSTFFHLMSNFLYRFDYYGVGTDDLSKVKQTLFMFIDLFGLEKFDYNTLARKLIIIKQLNKLDNAFNA